MLDNNKLITIELLNISNCLAKVLGGIEACIFIGNALTANLDHIVSHIFS
jgi:hypothetical protein